MVGGVDTHRDTHVGAVVDTAGRLLGSAQFRADPAGYAQLVAPMESWGRISRVGVEGTGSYGAGLSRHLLGAGIDVVEVNRPNRQLRRQRGKVMAISEIPQSRSSKFPTPGVLVSLVVVSFRSVFAGLGLVGAEPVAVSRDGEHDASVQEPVQHGSSDCAVGEDVSPRRDVAVGGQDC